jgi:hypothetical protein
MMVTSAAATAAAVTFGEMLDTSFLLLDELRHDSRNATSNGTNGSDDSDELRLRHIRPTPHRLTLLKLEQACFDPVKGSEDPVDLSITHTRMITDATAPTLPLGAYW